MELNRRELLKSLAGGVAALAVVAVPLPLEAESCDCEPCSPGEIEVSFEPAGEECDCEPAPIPDQIEVTCNGIHYGWITDPELIRDLMRLKVC